MKNRKLFTAISVLITALVATSCGKEETETKQIDYNHQSKITETDSYFVENGISDYKIVVPKTSSEYYKYAQDELIKITSEATGFTLTIEENEVETHEATQKYISLGDTKLFASTGLEDKKSDLKRNGSKIITKDNNVYIFAKDDAGVLYGVYDFLKIYFNFETYTSKIYKVDKGVKNIKFKAIEEIDNPDIEYRQRRGVLNPTTTAYDDKMFAYRMRALDGYGNMLLPIHSGDTKESSFRQEHNSFYYFPLEKYQVSHPDFYGGTGQLCFTAHGNTKEFNNMVDIAAEKIEQCLTFYPAKDYPNYNAVELGINDNGNNSMCTCSACTEFKKNHNNSNCAAVIYFYKLVGKKVNLWMEMEGNEEYKRDLTYIFLAYQDTLVPPFESVETIPDDIKIHDYDAKVAPFVALSGSDLTRKLTDPENVKCKSYIEKWGSAYPGAWAWCYGGFFNDYLTFFDMYSFYTEYHAYLKQYKFSFTFEQICDMQRGATTGFLSLSDYVLFKKAWNSSLDNEELIDDYLHNVYSSAYQPMKQMFTEWRLWFARNQLNKHWGEGSNQKSPTADWYEPGFIKQMLGLYDDAITAIDSYKDDPVMYQKYKDSIDAEFIAIAKPAIGYFESNFTSEEYANLKSKMKEVLSRLGVSRLSEFSYIADYIKAIS